MYLRGNRRWPGALVMSGGTLQWTECLCLSIVSLHNRRFISQARWTRHFQKNVRNVREARDEGRRKIKRLLPVHCCGSSALLRPQVLTDDGDVKSADQTHDPLLANCRLSGYKKHRQQHNCKPQEITARAKIIFNNLRPSAARVRFAQSKFSLCPTIAVRKKKGKTCCSNQIPRWRVWTQRSCGKRGKSHNNGLVTAALFFSSPRHALRAKCRVRLAWLIKRLLCTLFYRLSVFMCGRANTIQIRHVWTRK